MLRNAPSSDIKLTQPHSVSTFGGGHSSLHFPLLQVAASAHLKPHAPQLSFEVRRFVSQPFSGSPSQSARSPTQLNLHAPSKHVKMPARMSWYRSPAQAFPHAPQF